jgi:predicted small integral membrane protein
MTDFFWKDCRLAWAPVLAFLACVAAMLVGDYFWRVSGMPGSAVLGFLALILGLGIGAVIRDWTKRKNSTSH